MDYLPEWKLYLWKKLLLNTEGFDEGDLTIQNLMFFSDEERSTLTMEKWQRTSRSPSPWKAVDPVYQKSIENDYYNCHPIQIMGALVELMDNEPQILSITAQLDKGYVAWYREAKKTHETTQHAKYLASRSMERGTVSGPYKQNPKYMGDPFCGLGKTVYEKTENDQMLTPDEFRVLTRFAYKHTHDFIVCNLNIHKDALRARLDEYIANFIAGELVAPHGVLYFDPDRQRKSVYTSIEAMTAIFVMKNLPVTVASIAQYGRWTVGDEPHYRIFETLFSLERTGEIEISNLRGDEVILSLKDKTEVENPATRQLSSADQKRLFILEKLKEAYDLAPKENSGPTMLQAGSIMYEQRAGEVDISQHRFSQWMRECGIDYFQLENILVTFKQEGLIEDFNTYNEYG